MLDYAVAQLIHFSSCSFYLFGHSSSSFYLFRHSHIIEAKDTECWIFFVCVNQMREFNKSSQRIHQIKSTKIVLSVNPT